MIMAKLIVMQNIHGDLVKTMATHRNLNKSTVIPKGAGNILGYQIF
jgi:hypothetical protein